MDGADATRNDRALVAPHRTPMLSQWEKPIFVVGGQGLILVPVRSAEGGELPPERSFGSSSAPTWPDGSQGHPI